MLFPGLVHVTKLTEKTDSFPGQLTVHTFPAFPKYINWLEICHNNCRRCYAGLFFVHFWPRVLKEYWQIPDIYSHCLSSGLCTQICVLYAYLSGTS